jgi:hypothetical protein
VSVGLALAVGLKLGVRVGLALGLGVALSVGLKLGVRVGLKLGVAVGVQLSVALTVALKVGVAVAAAVSDAVAAGLGLKVDVNVSGGETVLLGEGVTDGVVGLCSGRGEGTGVLKKGLSGSCGFMRPVGPLSQNGKA